MHTCLLAAMLVLFLARCALSPPPPHGGQQGQGRGQGKRQGQKQGQGQRPPAPPLPPPPSGNVTTAPAACDSSVLLAVGFGATLAILALAILGVFCWRKQQAHLSSATNGPFDYGIGGAAVPGYRVPVQGMEPTWVPLASGNAGSRLSCCKLPLPDAKKYHAFFSHKKLHSKHANRSAQLATSLKDMLATQGFIGFLDVDNLREINQEKIEQGVLGSCTMIVLLNDETIDSEWCRFEWEVANRNGIPVKCIVDVETCHKQTVISQLLDHNQVPNKHLLASEVVDYLDRYRKDVVNELRVWIGSAINFGFAGRTGDVVEMELRASMDSIAPPDTGVSSSPSKKKKMHTKKVALTKSKGGVAVDKANTEPNAVVVGAAGEL